MTTPAWLAVLRKTYQMGLDDGRKSGARIVAHAVLNAVAAGDTAEQIAAGIRKAKAGGKPASEPTSERPA